VPRRAIRERVSVDPDFAKVLRVGAIENDQSSIAFSKQLLENPQLFEEIVNERKKKRPSFPTF